jgi:sugar (glycoside-pentoside-hexuronide) transporter
MRIDMEESMKKNFDYVTKKGERFSFGLYVFGAILSYYMIYSYLQLYLTDIGVPAAIVGLIFIVAKIWDAVNDPMFGVIVDRAHLKKGKFLPWIKLASLAIPLTTIFMFFIPSSATLTVKIVWAIVAYILWDTAYTMYDVPVNGIVTSMTPNLNERNVIYAIASFCIYLGGLLVAILVPSLYSNLGWGIAGLIIGVLCLVTMRPLDRRAKERLSVAVEKQPSIKEILSNLLHNKYLLIYVGIAILGSLTNFQTTLQTYFAIHCLGGTAMLTPLALATAVPVLLVVPFVPKVIKKFDKFKVFIVAKIISVIFDVIIFSVGYQNITVLLLLLVVKQIFTTFWATTGIMFVADCVEYGNFISGNRAQGITFSLKAFTNKMIVALAGAFGMFALAAVGFVEGTNVVQSASTISGIWFLYSFFPVIGGVVSSVLMLLFYKLRDKDVQIMSRCNAGELSQEEAKRQLHLN